MGQTGSATSETSETKVVTTSADAQPLPLRPTITHTVEPVSREGINAAPTAVASYFVKQDLLVCTLLPAYAEQFADFKTFILTICVPDGTTVVAKEPIADIHDTTETTGHAWYWRHKAMATATSMAICLQHVSGLYYPCKIAVIDPALESKDAPDSTEIRVRLNPKVHTVAIPVARYPEMSQNCTNVFGHFVQLMDIHYDPNAEKQKPSVSLDDEAPVATYKIVLDE
jgi:hypothetical protein